MIYGGTDKEQIQFNEDTLWTGDETDTGAYQAFGDIIIELGHDHPDDYRRMLNLSNAVHTITYENKGIRYKRECFASSPAGVIVCHFTADRPAPTMPRCLCRIATKARLPAVTTDWESPVRWLDTFISQDRVRGRMPTPMHWPWTMKPRCGFAMRVALRPCKTAASQLTNVDSFTVFLAAGTDYVNQRDRGWKGEHPHNRIEAQLSAASQRPYDALLREHIQDYQSLYGRLTLDVGTSPTATGQLPTDQRLEAYQQIKPDPDLEELVFNYARYLMISSSRPGTMPANLQGLWNNSNQPPWRCDYHTDVNIEMNYWFVDQANLSECFQPLPEWVNSIREVRKAETKAAFNTRGWLTHAENGVFGGSTWKWSKGDAAWVAQNLWDHYAFTQDVDYLRTRAYPVMTELCEFWVDHLKELPDGTLVSPDGFSPEHGPHEDGVSFDQQLVWDLFTNFLEASETLGVDGDLQRNIASMKPHLSGPTDWQVGTVAGMDGRSG